MKRLTMIARELQRKDILLYGETRSTCIICFCKICTVFVVCILFSGGREFFSCFRLRGIIGDDALKVGLRRTPLLLIVLTGVNHRPANKNL